MKRDVLPSHSCSVSLDDIGGLLDMSSSEVSTELGEGDVRDLRFRILTGSERDSVMLQILRHIDETDLRVVGENDNSVWERGWGEVLEKVRSSTTALDEALKPQYFAHHQILRFGGEYIDTGDAQFVYHIDQVLRRVLIRKFLSQAEHIVELGCGTGTTQVLLARMLPQAELTASDWAAASQKLIAIIGARLNRPIRPVRFNMLTLEGWSDLGITTCTAIVTIHAMEQLGTRWSGLLEKILHAKPNLCVHLEPLVELYSQQSLPDYLAAKYHRKRNYLSGYYPEIRRLEASRRAEVLYAKRLGLGDRYHEAYSVLVWRPL